MFDKSEALALRAKAYAHIRAVKPLWKLWNDAIEIEDRELLMAWVIKEQAFEAGSEHGYEQALVGVDLYSSRDYNDRCE